MLDRLSRGPASVSQRAGHLQVREEGGGKRTRLVYTEQITFLDGHDKVEWREGGIRELFGKLDVYLQRTNESASPPPR